MRRWLSLFLFPRYNWLFAVEFDYPRLYLRWGLWGRQSWVWKRGSSPTQEEITEKKDKLVQLEREDIDRAKHLNKMESDNTGDAIL